MKRLLLLIPLCFACEKNAARGPDVYEGCATDENALTLDDYASTGRVRLDAQQAPRWLEPMSGDTVSAAPPPTLRWQPSPTDAGRPNGTASCPDRCPTCRVVPAHLPPVSGNVFDLHIYAGGTEVYRVLTTLQSFKPDPAVWTGWAGMDMAVDIVGAAMLRNEVAAGPFRSEALRIKVRP